MTTPSFMDLALKAAETAGKSGEVPIGCVIVRDNEVIAAAGNRTLTERDPTAHAEILAIRLAAEVIGSERLVDCDLYATTCRRSIPGSARARRRRCCGIFSRRGGERVDPSFPSSFRDGPKGPDPESRDSGFATRPGMTSEIEPSRIRSPQKIPSAPSRWRRGFPRSGNDRNRSARPRRWSPSSSRYRGALPRRWQCRHRPTAPASES